MLAICGVYPCLDAYMPNPPELTEVITLEEMYKEIEK